MACACVRATRLLADMSPPSRVEGYHSQAIQCVELLPASCAYMVYFEFMLQTAGQPLPLDAQHLSCIIPDAGCFSSCSTLHKENTNAADSSGDLAAPPGSKSPYCMYRSSNAVEN